ncbi:TIGR02587 family membrane protein [Altericista sp. CCNU0014]|uniref:TIGR02587 family membrane protein n=1 Tax=Altericista sp. CCNU0014 TaxID=3082949 RepID=UPI00384F415E
MPIDKQRRQNLWRNELSDLVRGISGGFLFGIPLLYTMEVWWVGSSAEPPRLSIAIALTFSIVFLLNQTTGFRNTVDVRVRDTFMDSVETLALGLLCTTCVLVLFQEITLSTPLGEALGKLIYESVPFSLGVALSNQFLSDKSGDKQDSQEDRSKPNKRKQELNGTVADIGATAIGGIIVAFSIAPTDEVPMLAASTSGPWLLALTIASLLISYAIVFAANFSNQSKRRQQQGVFQDPFSETVVSYLVSLVVAAAMLWFFDTVSLDDPWSTWLSHTLILGLPATVGGAAGRLAI